MATALTEERPTLIKRKRKACWPNEIDSYENAALNYEHPTRTDNGFIPPGCSPAEIIENDHWSHLTLNQKVEKLATVGFSITKKAQYVKKFILDSFLSDERDPRELETWMKWLKVKHPSIAGKLLSDILKLEHGEKLLKIKERGLETQPSKSPIIIVQSNTKIENIIPPRGADLNITEKPRQTIDAAVLNSEAENAAIEEINQEIAASGKINKVVAGT